MCLSKNNSKSHLTLFNYHERNVFVVHFLVKIFFCRIVMHPYLRLYGVMASLHRIEYPILLARRCDGSQATGTHQRTISQARRS